MNDRRRYLGVVFIALMLALVYGSWYSYSVIMVALLREYGWSRSLLAGAFSVFTLVQGICNPLVGVVCDRVRPERLVAAGSVALGLALWLDSFISSPWQLYVFFGLFSAIGVSITGWVPALVQVQRRFSDRVGLGVGIASAGVGVGMVLVVPACQWLIEAFGWRTAYRVHALACVALALPIALYLVRTAPRGMIAKIDTDAGAPEKKTAGLPTRSMTLIQAMRTMPFWLVMAAFFLGNVCSQTLHVHQVAYLVDHGVAAMFAASVVAVVGVSSIVGKIGSGWLSDRIEREFIYVGGIAVMVGSIVLLTATTAALSPSGAYLYAVMLGTGYSVTAAITPLLASDRFSGRHFGVIVGFGLFHASLGSALGPWLAGFLFDVTGSYALPFTIAACCGVLTAGVGWTARVLRIRATLAVAR